MPDNVPYKKTVEDSLKGGLIISGITNRIVHDPEIST